MLLLLPPWLLLLLMMNRRVCWVFTQQRSFDTLTFDFGCRVTV